ncbi:hypothetical protein AGMMS49982_09310 [Bacteroidia bacterium]|nr:hypothetical protein AGMMS49982_09310 [Bacteroidia bacterium]
MDNKELQNILAHLLNNKVENEVVEFKKAENNYDFDKLGNYFSALCNEANLLKQKEAWLVPPAPQGMPIAFDGHYYGRDGESLVPLNIEELERIRNQANSYDWTKEIIPDATLNDLDEQAIQKARIEFVKRNPKYEDEIDGWDNAKFLNKAKLTVRGKITRAAFILLGKEEEEHLLDSAVKIRWLLRTVTNEDKDFEIFSVPFILAVEKVVLTDSPEELSRNPYILSKERKIKNVTYGIWELF